MPLKLQDPNIDKRPDWDTYFGLLAKMIAIKSDDEETKIGSIIVDEQNRIVSTGYNGTPRGTNLPTTRPEKYPFMVHSEKNALLFAPALLQNHKLYVTHLYPCTDCAKAICQKGISEVIIVDPEYKSRKKSLKDWGFKNSELMFDQVGVKVRHVYVPTISLLSTKIPIDIKLK